MALKQTQNDSASFDILLKHKYVPALDGVRALSMAYVMCAHIFSHTVGASEGRLVHAASSVFVRGWFGVDVFFVLSGFLITWILSEELAIRGTISFKRFYLRRCLRLVPAYLSAIGFAAILGALLSRKLLYQLVVSLPLLLTYTLNFALAHGRVVPGPIGVTWSLCIEEQFYLLWPMVLWSLGATRALKAAAWTIGTILAWRIVLYLSLSDLGTVAITVSDVQRFQFSTDTRIDVILTGCVLALLMRLKYFGAIWEWLSRPTAWVIASIPLPFAVAAFGDIRVGSSHLALSITLGYTVMAFASAIFLASLVLNPTCPLAQGLSVAPLVFIGGVSYGGYLFHPDIEFVVSFIARHLYQSASAVPFPARFAAAAAFFVGTIAFAALHSGLIEKRFRNLGKQFVERRSLESATTPVA